MVDDPNGGLVKYTDHLTDKQAALDAQQAAHAVEVERLIAERDALKGIVNDCMSILGMTQTAWDGTDIPRGESDLPRWVRDVADASYRKGKECDAAVRERDALAEALRPFSGLDIRMYRSASDDTEIFGMNDSRIHVGDVRRARAALSKIEGVQK